jgi:hypothetical protein
MQDMASQWIERCYEFDIGTLLAASDAGASAVLERIHVVAMLPSAADSTSEAEPDTATGRPAVAAAAASGTAAVQALLGCLAVSFGHPPCRPAATASSLELRGRPVIGTGTKLSVLLTWALTGAFCSDMRTTALNDQRGDMQTKSTAAASMQGCACRCLDLLAACRWAIRRRSKACSRHQVELRIAAATPLRTLADMHATSEYTRGSRPRTVAMSWRGATLCVPGGVRAAGAAHSSSRLASAVPVLRWDLAGGCRVSEPLLRYSTLVILCACCSCS